MWPDNETTNDLIGFKVHADLIRAVVTNPAMLPTTIGIFGDWGGGKTSIMKMLERDLDPDNWPNGSAEHNQYEKVAVIYANAWLFEGYDDTKAAILSSVLLELAEHKRFGAKIRDAATSLLRNVNWMRIARIALKHVAIPAATAFFTGGVSAIPSAVALSTGLSSIMPQQNTNDDKKDTDKVGDDKGKIDLGDIVKKSPFQDETLDIRTFRQRFKKMLEDGGIEILVVLVDDLDRCTPERIIDNLEAVKLFLSVEQTAFVIGADRRIVEHAIRSRYSEHNDEETQRLVKDYLEKLVQVPYSLPRLSACEIETYMTLLFCQRHLKVKEMDECLKGCEDNRTQNRYASFGYANVRAALKGTDLNPELTSAPH
jgi:predicted KAP-like P-loop ATPase